MKYYNVRQLDQTDCAAACLASVSFFYGKEITITKLIDRFDGNFDGMITFGV